ncbi:MAG: metallophosphoesterase, partial [Oscillospiraceae bacterium]|nr:metallophosphoesterase [Oscillospiraceae bacterium]
MKILVLSDSHRNVENIKLAISLTGPDLVLHLGDHITDCATLNLAFPQIPVRCVGGNCDRGNHLENDEFVIEGKRFFMTHGHNYGVKFSLKSLVNNAMARGADIVLYGHTHVRHYEEYEGLHILNPGSCQRELNVGIIDIT